MEVQTACRKCGAEVSEQMRFCSRCGKRLAARSGRYIPLACGLAVLLFGGGIALQMAIRGKPMAVSPGRSGMSAPAKDEVGSSVENEPPQLTAMRQELEKNPADLSKLRIFAGMLGDVLRSNPAAPPALVFEAIDVFGRILQQEPNDPGALVMMADLSFDQRAFTKALDFYERYLKVEPNDLGARSRYASTLTFLGRYDESINELNSVLKTEPKNFPAMAYLAITYAQKGDIATAKKVGGDALTVAPSEDARARFSSFVSSLDAPGSVEPALNGAAANTVKQVEGASPAMKALESSLKANPVAGPKFVALRKASEVRLELVYRDFPMAQMPPFAKEKFLSGVKAAIAQNKLPQVREVVFVDHQTGAVMESMQR